ncbi:uncharacterized protein LOC103513918 isoform X2 [Diaphorina citri]|nr:uncharacterized protein LOC103513918 isoform X2 [Diaphorina citri]
MREEEAQAQLKWDRLSDEVLDELVRQVEKRPTLYNTTHEDYGRPPAREVCWVSISQEISEFNGGTLIPRDLLKTRWRNLRDAFIKLHRKREAGIQLKLPRRKVQFMKSMRFLIPFIAKRRNPLPDKRYQMYPRVKSEKTANHDESNPIIDYDEIIPYEDSSDSERQGTTFLEDHAEQEIIQTMPDINIEYEDDNADEEEVNDESEGFEENADGNEKEDHLSNIKLVNVESLQGKKIGPVKNSLTENQNRAFLLSQASVNPLRMRSRNDLSKVLESVMQLNENELFFLSMARMVGTLPMEKQFEIRSQVHEIVSSAQLENMK